MGNFVDRKRAASGERDEEAGMPLASPQSLVEALRAPRTKQHSSEPVKELVVPVVQAATVYMPKLGHLGDVVEQHPMNWVTGMHPALQDDREIIVAFAKSTTDDKLGMAIDIVKSTDLSKDDPNHPDLTQPMMRLHPMVYQSTIIRRHLPDNPAVIEVAFYSRQIGKEAATYLGKTKLFFPRPYVGMRFYLDLSKLR